MNWRVFGKLNAETIARLEKTHDNDYWAHVPNKRGRVRAIIGHMCPIIVLLVFAAPRARLSLNFIFFLISKYVCVCLPSLSFFVFDSGHAVG